MRSKFTLVEARPFELPGKSTKAQSTAQKSCQNMISYRAKLAEYFAKRKAIGITFCIVAAKAEDEFKTATESANTTAARDAAHDVLKARFRSANQARATALEELGPPPVLPI